MSIRDITTEIAALSPAVESAKKGTEHEGHDGWGMNGRLPGLAQCSCGAPLDAVLGLEKPCRCVPFEPASIYEPLRKAPPEGCPVHDG